MCEFTSIWLSLTEKLWVTQSSCSDASCFLHGIIEQLVPACVPSTSAGREVRHTGKRKKLANAGRLPRLNGAVGQGQASPFTSLQENLL